MSRYGLTVVVCLLVAGGLIAGQTGAGIAAVGAPSTLRPSDFVGTNSTGSQTPRISYVLADNDVGVSTIISPGEYAALGDTVLPRCEVKNFGSQTQTDVPVTCVIYDSAAGSRVYGPETVYVASLGPGSVDTVEFPCWVPPAEEKVYFDTMATALPGDEDRLNDWKAGRFAVSESCVGWLTYNDGVFDNGVRWVGTGEWACGFATPMKPLMVDSANIWMTSLYGSDFAEQVFIYGDDGPNHIPGTLLGSWSGDFHTSICPSAYKNIITFSPAVWIDYDSFYVSWYDQTIQTDTDDIYIGLFIDGAPEGAWGRSPYPSGSWGHPFMGDDNIGIDVHYRGLLTDALLEDITVPQAHMDSNTTFTPRIVVKNTGLMDRNDIPVTFSIVRDSALGDTIYAGSANSGPIQAGQTKVVTFPDSVTPEPGYYTMTSITLLPYDARPANDTLVGQLSVGLGIADVNVDPGRASVSIAPNPLSRSATVRYSLPKAGLATLDVFDVTGRPC